MDRLQPAYKLGFSIDLMDCPIKQQRKKKHKVDEMEFDERRLIDQRVEWKREQHREKNLRIEIDPDGPFYRLLCSTI